EEIEFQKSAAIDLNDNGDQQLDAIVKRVKIDGTYQVKQKIRFFYDSKGHAVGHPYSKLSSNGLTKLNEIAIEDRNGEIQPYMKFFYYSNPGFQRTGSPYNGYFTHDFYGYYSSLPITGLKNPFLNNDGHSTKGAAAWSIKRVVYGNGKIIEYEYEPNEINAFTTAETTPLLHGPGVRVYREKVYSGTGDSLVTTYKYGKGFTSFNMALASFLQGGQPANYLGEIYLLLNYGQLWNNMQNVLLLSGNSVIYDQCEEHTTTGYERTQFLSPNDNVPEYGGDRTICLADDKYGKSSKANYRGAVKRIEIFKNDKPENPVYSRILSYELKHDYHTYIMPYLDIKADFVGCRDIPIGSPSQIGDPPSFPDEDIRDLLDTTFIGYLRNVNAYEERDGISIKEELSYDMISGSVKKSRKCNSDRICLESEKIFTHEISDYSWMTAKNMLMQTAGMKMWLSNPSHNSGIPEIVGSSANTWLQEYGGYSDQGFVWKVDMGTDGFPVTAYTSFNHTTKSGTTWIKKGKTTKLDDFQRVLESEGVSANEYQCIIYRQDIGMPLAKITNGRYDNCAVFTCDYDLSTISNPNYFDYLNRWEKGLVSGAGHLSEVSSVKAHFGLKSIHVKNTYGPTRNVAIDRTKRYVFSAWVFPLATTRYIRFAVELRDQNNVIQARKDYVKESPVSNQWQLVEHTFDLSDVAIERIDGTGDYFRIWVGNGESEAYYDELGYARPEFYIDDIRFYPSNGLVTSIYYDPFAGKPVSQVDVNSKCQGIIEYDGFGNIKKSFKRNLDGTKDFLSQNDYNLQNNLTSHEIRILSPNGGETIKKNIAVPIKWISSNDVTAVDIQVSIDNGASWTNVSAGISRDGNSVWGDYLWTPNVGP
ncbi:MAG: hypothetical protein GX640_22000, partial [Fibrobacter sp.]|nr:hypothetical protein [Fibrobacter sp.]